MKITILTFQGSHNYGAILQAHALQSHLEDCGHEAGFLNFVPDYVVRHNLKIPPVKNLKSLVLNIVLIPFRKKLKKRYERFESYRRNHLKTSRLYETIKQIQDDPPDPDVFVVGSDQVWNMERGGDPYFFLQFLKVQDESLTKPVIAYAPSFGTGHVPAEYEDRFKDWAKVFDFVSVRESSGKILAEKLLDREVPQVLDPVFLHDRHFWEKAACPRPLAGPYIAFYSLEATGKVSECLLKMAKHLKMPVVVLGKPGPFMLKCRTRVAVDAGPSEFLGWIRHAAFVVTNSFHATAFSAVFEVPFMTVSHSTRNARMESLLKLLGQESRIVHQPGDLTDERMETLVESSSSETSALLQEAVDQSKTYLSDSLAKAGEMIH
jgi:hypothetical protein